IILSNSLWMMSEKLISIFGLVFVTSFVAKYVGPGVFGTIALAMSTFQLVQLVSLMGTDILIFKRISRNKKSGVNLINITFPIRCFVYVFLSIPILVYFSFDSDWLVIFFLIAAFAACFIQSLDVYSIFYDATLNSKVNTFVNAFGLVISLVLRWLIAALELDPVLLCIPIVLTPLVPFMIRYLYFIKKNTQSTIPRRHRKKYYKYIIGAGSSFVIASISVAIYTRLSLLMLGAYDGATAAGIYSVAATLATSWIFIHNSLITSSLPSIFSENNDALALIKTAKLNVVILVTSIPIILGFFILGKWFIGFFYGVEYLASYDALLILNFAAVLASLGTISARFIAKYSGYTFLSIKMCLVAVFSLGINLILIKEYHIVGASIASVLTQFVSLTVFNYPFKNGIVFKLHCRTFYFR
ncbi:oligosaccharide flippase family protein, partial [Pluralibacter gergoviae]